MATHHPPPPPPPPTLRQIYAAIEALQAEVANLSTQLALANAALLLIEKAVIKPDVASIHVSVATPTKQP